MNSFFLSVTNVSSPIASVCFAFERSTNFAKIYSIQGPVKLEIARKVIIGFVSGSTIWKNVRAFDAPSIFAASSSVRGIEST